KIAYKEAWETKFWIKLCLKSESLPNPENLLDQLESIIKLLGKIISSTRR
ncbi:MAG TPA: four helix bundle protein, partial [Flavobacteriales bacterium]|nr:four helix bundle protein [Flavobacteriales bacterium]